MEEITRVKYPSYRPASKGIIEFVLIWPIALSGIAAGATGAIYARDMSATQLATPFIRIRQSEDKNYARSVAEHLLNIRDALDLKMSELARIFGVSRPAAYAWLDGTLPKPEIVRKICDLSTQADSLRAAGIGRLGHFSRRPVVAGRSLVDLLNSGDDVAEALAVIKRTALRETKTRNLTSRHGRSKKSGISAADEVSNPIMIERV
jgi:hypothetical protein